MKKSLEKQMNEILDASLKNVQVTTDQAARIAARQSVAALRVVSPKKTGAYAADWMMEAIRGRGGSRQIGAFSINGYRVRNAHHYQLTHLLEYGHGKVNGGRTKKFEHIKPVEERGIQTFSKMIKQGIY